MNIYSLAYVLNHIKLNAKKRKLRFSIQYTNKNFHFVQIFKKLGLLSTYYLVKNLNKKFITVHLLFFKNLMIFYNFKIISKPGKPIYISYRSLILISKKMGLALFLLSTAKGVITLKHALQLKCGGELLGYV